MIKKNYNALFVEQPNNSKGFTLLELMIAILLLASISFFTARTLKNIVTNSKRIQGDIDMNTEVHAAIGLLKSDISRAFNSRDLYIAVYNEAQREHIKRWQEKQKNPQAQTKSQQTTGDPANPAPVTGTAANPDIQNQQNQNAGPPPEYKPRTELVLTHFIGEKSKVEFASINGNSIRKNTPTSELIEVGYEIKNCKKRGKNGKSTECLWRRLSYYLDGDIKQGGQESVLLDDVTVFELKYLRKQTEDEVEWRDNWPLDNTMTQDRLPSAVEITLEVEKPTDKDGKVLRKKRVVAYIPIDFENNQNIRNILKMNSQGNPYESNSTNGQNNLQFQNIDQNYGTDPNSDPNGGF